MSQSVLKCPLIPPQFAKDYILENYSKESSKHCLHITSIISTIHFTSWCSASFHVFGFYWSLFFSFISHQRVMSSCGNPEFIWSAIMLYMTTVVALLYSFCIGHNCSATGAQITAQAHAWNSVLLRFSTRPIVVIYCPPDFQLGQ